MGDVQLLNKDLKCTRKRNRLDSNESKIFSEEIYLIKIDSIVKKI